MEVAEFSLPWVPETIARANKQSENFSVYRIIFIILQKTEKK
jgi:hypothetical protein